MRHDLVRGHTRGRLLRVRGVGDRAATGPWGLDVRGTPCLSDVPAERWRGLLRRPVDVPAGAGVYPYSEAPHDAGGRASFLSRPAFSATAQKPLRMKPREGLKSMLRCLVWENPVAALRRSPLEHSP